MLALALLLACALLGSRRKGRRCLMRQRPNAHRPLETDARPFEETCAVQMRRVMSL